ncbi:9184_t:CDS:1, partial [Scutellospora calospora]
KLERVNYSKYLKDSKTDVHINTIETTSYTIKVSFLNYRITKELYNIYFSKYK